ncbi:MAG: FUSC family protein [Actinomycetes bacterium]
MNRAQDSDDLLPDLELGDVLRQRPLGLGSVRHVVRVSLAVTVSFGIALFLSKSTLGIFAPITTLLVVQASPWTTLGMSIQRILGTGIGVLVASVWVNLAGLNWWSFTIGVFVALLVARALPWSIGGQMQIPVAVIFVLALGPGSLTADLWRVVDVVIGGVVGLLAVFVYPPRPKVEPFETALANYRDGIAHLLRLVADESGTHATPLDEGVRHGYVAESRGLRALADKARAELIRLVESAHWNMRAKGVDEQFDGQAARLRRLTGIGIQVRGIVGAASRMYDREDQTAMLSVAELRSLVDGELELMSVVLGPLGEPVHGTDRSLADALVLDLGETMRTMTDTIVDRRGEGTLAAVSLVGRFDHIRQQLAEYPGWED